MCVYTLIFCFEKLKNDVIISEPQDFSRMRGHYVKGSQNYHPKCTNKAEKRADFQSLSDDLPRRDADSGSANLYANRRARFFPHPELQR